MRRENLNGVYIGISWLSSGFSVTTLNMYFLVCGRRPRETRAHALTEENSASSSEARRLMMDSRVSKGRVAKAISNRNLS